MKKCCMYFLLIFACVSMAGIVLQGCGGKKEPPKEEEEDSYKTLANLGLSLFGQRKFDEAANYWEQALQKEPNNPKNAIICNDLFIIYFQRRKYDDCERIVNIGLKIDPTNPALLNQKATLYKISNKLDEAIAVLLKAESSMEQNNIKDYHTIGNLADCYRLEKEYKKAEDVLNKFIKKDEENKKPDEAINSTVAFLYHHLGMVKKDEGKIKEAMDDWKKALEISPEQDISHYQLALAYEETGQIDKAIEHYKNVLRINPNHVFALNNLGYLYAQKGTNLVEAEKMINRAMALDPTANSITLDSLAWVHFKMKRFDQALSEVTKAIELTQEMYISAQNDPNKEVTPEYSKTLADYYYHKGSIEKEMNKKDDAKTAFKKSLEYNPSHQESKDALKELR